MWCAFCVLRCGVWMPLGRKGKGVHAGGCAGARVNAGTGDLRVWLLDGRVVFLGGQREAGEAAWAFRPTI